MGVAAHQGRTSSSDSRLVEQDVGRIALILQNPLFFTSFFRNFAIKMAKLLQLGIKNKWICFVLLSFFRNFVRICRISLNKGSLGDWGKSGFLPCKRPFGPSDELETVLNSTFCYKLLSARAPLACYQRDARKVIICFELAKLSFSFFNKMYFFIFYHI